MRTLGAEPAPIEGGPGGPTGPPAKGKGLGAEKLIPSAASTGWAVDTLNEGPVLRSKIVPYQRDKD